MENRIIELISLLKQITGSIELIERHENYIKFKIEPKEMKLGNIFGIIENKRNQFGIKEYCISQTTLDQIFNYFANNY